MMDYQEYLGYREQVKNEYGVNLVDAGDLDLYGKFPRFEAGQPLTGHKNGNVHRCHLVEDFLRFFELDFSKNEVAYSEGVRHSLAALMKMYSDKHWLIPTDNYPFYNQTAKELGLKHSGFDTLKNGFQGSLSGYDTKGDILLLTYPLKPSGRGYEDSDWDFLSGWLVGDRNRKIVFDAVYVNDFSQADDLMNFYRKSKQVNVLYSLSKSFASPKVAGFTFTKDKNIREAFKSLPADKTKMRECYALLNTKQGSDRYEEIKTFIGTQFGKAVEAGIISPTKDRAGYLFYMQGHRDDYLMHNILTVPVSVYGSKASGVIVSTLGL